MAEVKAPEKKEEEKPIDPRLAALRGERPRGHWTAPAARSAHGSCGCGAEVVFNVHLLERSVISKESRLVVRALRSTNGFRRKVRALAAGHFRRRAGPQHDRSMTAVDAWRR